MILVTILVKSDVKILNRRNIRLVTPSGFWILSLFVLQLNEDPTPTPADLGVKEGLIGYFEQLTIPGLQQVCLCLVDVITKTVSV